MSVSYRLPEKLEACGYELERQNIGSHFYYVLKASKNIGTVFVSIDTVRYSSHNDTFEKPYNVKISKVNVNDDNLPVDVLEKAFFVAIS